MPSVKLDIPYHSQWDPDAGSHFSDCGPTSLAMLLGALGQYTSPDNLYRYIGQRGASEYTSFTDLVTAAKALGLPMTRKNFLSATAIQDLKTALAAGTPFIALINYAFWDPIVHNNFRGSHFVLVTGFDDTTIYIHDPLFRGARRDQGKFCPYTYDQFMSGWNGFVPGQNPNCAALVSGKTVPFLGAAPVSVPVPPAAPAQIVIDDMMVRRLRAKAAYDGQPDPNLDDPVLAQALAAALGNWGAAADSYTVRRGDSLTTIATMFYGDREKWKVIVYFNNIAHPSLLAPGDVYLLPRPELTPAADAKVPLPGHGGPTG
jgi:hypothetical protein